MQFLVDVLRASPYVVYKYTQNVHQFTQFTNEYTCQFAIFATLKTSGKFRFQLYAEVSDNDYLTT